MGEHNNSNYPRPSYVGAKRAAEGTSTNRMQKPGLLRNAGSEREELTLGQLHAKLLGIAGMEREP